MLGVLVLLLTCWPTTPTRRPLLRVMAATSSTQSTPTKLGTRTLASQTLPNAGPALTPPSADHRLDRPPSISASHIDAILATYQSPATGTGAIFYAMGLKYGIDPAYALAFYVVESQAGTKGVARFTHSIGNIRTTSGYINYEGYRAYNSYAEGIEDWFKLIKELYIQSWGLTTPDTILPHYAPWGDNNNPTAYSRAVETLVDGWQGP